MNMNEFLYDFLVRSEYLTETEYAQLTESTKVESIKEIVLEVLNSLKDKLAQFDTGIIDRSHGDIKQLRELSSLQTAITQLETIIERSNEVVSKDLVAYLKDIIKSILFLNQYAAEFKEAYKDRKTLLVLKYQSLVMAIFSALAYLISVMIDFSSGDVQLQKNPEYEEIAPLRTIKEFNKSVEAGDFRMILKRMNIMKEHLVEVSPESQSILESADVMTMILDGLKNILGNSDKFVEFLYKAAGVITLILSMREVIYALFRARTKITDIVSMIENFAGVNDSGAGILAKLNSFASKFPVDAEESSKIAKREIESEDRALSSEIKSIPKRNNSLPDEETADTFSLGF